jgi:hypothetical protein
MVDKLFVGHAGLLQNSTQGANCQFSVQWDNAAGHLITLISLQHHVTAALTDLSETREHELPLPLRLGAV